MMYALTYKTKRNRILECVIEMHGIWLKATEFRPDYKATYLECTVYHDNGTTEDRDIELMRVVRLEPRRRGQKGE